MSKVLVTESYLSQIANAIRSKLGSSEEYRPGDMGAAILSIPTGGIVPTGTINITQNGTHDVTQYASANVNVQPNLQSKTATENGTVTPDTGYDGLSSVVVTVSGGGGGSTLLMQHGQVSDTSKYMTAFFTSPIDFSEYDVLLVFLYEDQIVHAGATKEAGQFVIDRNSYSNEAFFTMNITTTSISCTRYRGDYLNLYVDVYGIKL